MVGLLVVSHSADAAQGIRDIAAEMGGADAEIVPVGGDPDGGIGTSVPAIQEALDGMNSDEVVILVDLGSAVMNAEMAVETAEKEVVIADAPVLEGTLNAAVEAANPKGTLESVRDSAEEARDVSKL
ncbi:dihydroxyacetone kinase phosphoryl donor subunit DhaM [Halostella salina]|uniref:dihydroxyacetone kinase phosphoryl donor subunit DhaM n=1 Tax=Halostella salina TaxID=1547897 RepID=UPI000EF778F9|nr:dihydroxyacetone kinase phosphoryl donor subunit DhaM [Halostella salina]